MCDVFHIGPEPIPPTDAPLDDDDAEALASRLAAAVDSEDEDVAWLADMTVRFGVDYRGDPLKWGPHTTDAFLGWFLPTKVIAPPSGMHGVGEVMEAWIRLVAAETGRGIEDLDEHIEMAQALAGDAIGDLGTGSQRSMGGNIAAALIGDGVDITDQDAVARWIEEYNALPIEERTRISDRE